jgi:hypothetical protein
MIRNFGFKTFVCAILPIVVIAGLVSSAPAYAKDKGDILIRLRAVSFNPDVDGTIDQFGDSTRYRPGPLGGRRRIWLRILNGRSVENSYPYL